MALEVGKRVDDVRRLEHTVAPTDRDLPQDIDVDEACNGLVRLGEAAFDQLSGAVHCDDWSPDKHS